MHKVNLEQIENLQNYGNDMYELMKRLYPICRSITGNGVRQTLRFIQETIPLQIHEIPTGTKVFDWIIPKEWNIQDAYIKNSEGKKIVDFKKSNLHVLNYSIPINKKISWNELKEHIFTLPEFPDWIPYLTSYYKENWGFCMSHNQYKELKEDNYEIVIDSTLEEGHLTYGELYLKGDSQEEVLFSTYVCHPSLCNDNLSGVVLLTTLAKILKNMKLRYSYRFLFIPETIGAITWLSMNKETIQKIKHGLVATCLGDRGNSTYKKSRIGNAEIDRVVELMLVQSNLPFKIIEFFPSGSDERQFCSPGFNLPIGSLMRTPYDCFPEYHTSADNLGFIDSNSLADSLEKYIKVIYILENNLTYINTNPNCEPQLGRRGLYDQVGGKKLAGNEKITISWILNLSDGKNSLLDISLRSKIEFNKIKNTADLLLKEGLLEIFK